MCESPGSYTRGQKNLSLVVFHRGICSSLGEGPGLMAHWERKGIEMKGRSGFFVSLLLVLCIAVSQTLVYAEDLLFGDEIIAEEAGDGIFEVPDAMEAAEDDVPEESWDSSEEVLLDDNMVASFEAEVGLLEQGGESALEDGFLSEALPWEDELSVTTSPDELIASFEGDELVGSSLWYAVVLVIDLNSYMSGTPIRQVKDAAIAFCEKTINSHKSDQVGIAIVSMEGTDNTKRVVDFSSNLDVLKSEISKLTPVNGKCDISEGLALATAMLSQITSTEKSIILMTQGIPDEGNQSTSGYYSCSEGDTEAYANYAITMSDVIKSEYGCRIYTLGIGARVNENSHDFVKDFLGRVADYGSYFVKADEDMSAVMTGSIWESIFYPFLYERTARFISRSSTVDQVEIKVTIENHNPVELKGPYVTVTPGTNGKIVSGSAKQSVSSLGYRKSTTFRWTYEIDRTGYPNGGKHICTIKIGCTSTTIYYDSSFSIDYEADKANSITVKKTSVTVKSKGKKSTVKLGASAKTTLTYSSNVSAVKVSKAGKVTIPKSFLGKVTITVKAKAENGYKSAKKTVTINVIPKEPTNLKVQRALQSGNTMLRATWTKAPFKDGYQLEHCSDSSYKKLFTKRITPTSSTTEANSTISGTTITKVYSRIRAYKKYGGKTYYSEWTYFTGKW